MALKLKPINLRRMTFGIVSTSPMIQHCWSEKSKASLRMSALERRKQNKNTPRNPEEMASDATYQDENGNFGIPMLGFKASLIAAAHKDLGIEKTLLRKSIFFETNGSASDAIIPIKCDNPIIREDIVRVGMSQTDIRYRPEFTKWSAIINIIVDYDAINETDIVNLVNRAGFGVGICEWRPEKGGECGRYKIDTNVPVTTEKAE